MQNEWQSYERAVFDCDSTISSIEGIDELARLKGLAYEVSFLTDQAMNGKQSFDEVFVKRLELIKPERADLEIIGKMYVDNLVPDMKEVLETFSFLGIEIILVSGGYQLALEKLGKYLKIDAKNLYANRLLFDEKGFYKDFDQNVLLWQNGGKGKILEKLSKKKTVFIGDSITDLETKDVVDQFVGYGGIVTRDEVRLGSDIYVNSLSMIGLVPLIVGRANFKRLWNSEYRVLCVKSLMNLFEEDGVTFKKGSDKIYSTIKGEYYD